MFTVQENVSLKNKTTFKMGGIARYFTELNDKNDIPVWLEFSRSKNLPTFILGKGSNCIFGDGMIEMSVASFMFFGKEISEDNFSSVLVRFGAGEIWDDVVKWSVEHGYSGIEAMSAIPGTVGATPVQNVGAYGQETKDVLVEVEVYDTLKKVFTTLSNKECCFGYRSSIFNTTEKGRYSIVSATLRLSKKPATVPDYSGVKDYFEARNIQDPSGAEIREAIIAIRKEKLPDPSIIANVGSFFKNVIVEEGVAQELKTNFPDMPIFSAKEGFSKIPSGWFIEKIGLKGKSFGSISVYEKNALVLTHNTKGNFADLQQTKSAIIQQVKDAFEVTLEAEPQLIVG